MLKWALIFLLVSIMAGFRIYRDLGRSSYNWKVALLRRSSRIPGIPCPWLYGRRVAILARKRLNPRRMQALRP
jgi:hypothetical protein